MVVVVLLVQKAVHVLDSLRKLSYFSTLIIVWNCQMTNLIWWSSQAFRLSLTVSPLVSKEAGVLDAPFISVSTNLQGDVSSLIWTEWFTISTAEGTLSDLGICPRIHGNTKRLPENTLSQATVEGVCTFLTNYVEENAISLPGRIPGFKSDDIKVLSSSESKIGVWRVYEAACVASDVRAVSYRKFLQLWDQFHPNVVISKPATDLCFTCQQNTNKLQRAANLSDREKSECVKAHQDHLNCAQSEREYYRNSCINSENALGPIDTETVLDRESREACSLNVTVHYSFDYAQQVHIPSNPMQPGPIYFKTPRKCGIFGVMCEGLPRQVNFLIDEATSAGKGANATIIYVHYYFEHHGLGETDAQLNADNCSGQNKNNYFLWYFAWRTLMKLHHSITYSFLIAGHTKFAPDRSFGLIKKAFKVTYVSSLYEFARLVETSSTSGLNKAQLVGTHDGRVIVPVYDWSSFLGQYFKKLPNIKKFHHFRFSNENPGKVFYKEFVSSPEQSFMLLKNNAILPPPSILPDIVNPDGLTEERRNYLFREIRQFCKPGTEDIVAPAPWNNRSQQLMQENNRTVRFLYLPVCIIYISRSKKGLS